MIYVKLLYSTYGVEFDANIIEQKSLKDLFEDSVSNPALLTDCVAELF